MGFFTSVRKFFRSDAPTPDSAVEAKNIADTTTSADVSTESEAPEISPAAGETPAEHEMSVEPAASEVPIKGDVKATDTGASVVSRASTAKEAPVNISAGSVHAPPDANADLLTLALRQAEPKLSVWLSIVLQDVEGAGDLLWQRLQFLLKALEVPEQENRAFIESFRSWLTDMGYESLEDFRSELQYRLALALDLEDEEDEKSRLILKLSQGLSKTREQLAQGLNTLFAAGRAMDDAFWDELEEVLIMADVGFETAHALTERLRKRAAVQGVTDSSALRSLMRLELLEGFKPVRRISAVNPPEVVLLIGVNGAGKTTTIAKLCHRAVLQGKKVMVVAADTFRAAATEQLEIWAKRTGAGFYAKGHGADPAAVAFEAMEVALAEGYDTVFVDTAGRLHTKTNLMEELAKIRRVIGKQHPGAPHRTILVLDATTGQNGLSQVKLFSESCGVDDLILTKLDGTAKGGIAVAIALQYNIPISYVGLGEKMEDLRPFDAEAFVQALLGEAVG